MPPVEEVNNNKPEDPPIVTELKVIDDKYLAIEKEYEKEVNELMKKYTAKQKPFLDQRKQILTSPQGNEESDTGTPAIKGFWLKAMQNHQAFEDCIQEWDEPVLEYLVDIEKIQLDDDDHSKGFRLLFHFAENPYFTNKEIKKEYHTEETNPYYGDMETKKIVTTEIDWKAGKNVTVEKIAKKVKGGGAKKAKQKEKSKEKEEARPSFFRDFMRNLEAGMKPTPDMIEQAQAMWEDDDENEDDFDAVIDLLMENDFEVGCALRDNIIPFAVRWYTGEAAPEEDDDDEESEEEDDDDYDDDEEDSDDEPPKKTSAKKKGQSKPPKGNEPAPKQEECKQQ
mmetsp:Transcript_123026/g.244868  ORF Transcript_123026/g.244868 Transcript_123026/m.244868 type:complete len:338 (-) Transcript_123026:19-1032(-)